MSDFDDIKEFDEKECVRFIRAGLESEISTKYCDNELLDVLARRMGICREIGQYKKEHKMTIVQAGRLDTIMNSRCSAAAELGMDPAFMRAVFSAVHEESVRQQLDILNRR